MFVKLKIGKYRGEIIDMDPDAARRMVDQGNAEYPTYEDPPAKAVEESPVDPVDIVPASDAEPQKSAPSQPEAPKPSKRSRGKKN